MKTTLPAFALFSALLAGLSAAPTPKEDGPYPISFSANVEMKTRDGVKLSADVYRPKGDGKYPVILLRTPYNKRIYIGEGVAAATRGYAFVVQDARGRFESEGEWTPFRTEGLDSYDAVEWAATLPYSDGRVALAGISYVGTPVLLGAIEAPPHLVAIFPGITASNYHDNWAYQGGALCLMFDRSWASGMLVNELNRNLAAAPAIGSFPVGRAPVEMPVVDPAAVGREGAFYREWIAHPAYDDYWKKVSIEENFPKIKVPALHLGAWYDLFMPGAVRNYAGLRDQGGSPAARQGQRLVLIPGGHAGFGRKVGELDFGPEAAFDFWGYALRWFDSVIKGLDNGVSREKPVRIFVMGRNVWRDEDDWPLARAKTVRYYLHSAGHANTAAGDGALDTAAPAAEPADQFVFDPTNPVPTLGGVLAGPISSVSGPVDQRVVESRPDVLVYTTPAFAHDTEVTGPVALDLFIRSSAPDTDFTGKLVDVHPDGRAMVLSQGILRVRYRNSAERAELMQPGETYAIRVELLPTSNVFLAGHRLRLEVSSSNYPQYDLNPNTGAEPGTARFYTPATNRVLHDREHPSALVVQVVP